MAGCLFFGVGLSSAQYDILSSACLIMNGYHNNYKMLGKTQTHILVDTFAMEVATLIPCNVVYGSSPRSECLPWRGHDSVFPTL